MVCADLIVVVLPLTTMNTPGMQQQQVVVPTRKLNPEEARGKTTLCGREDVKKIKPKLQGRPSQVSFGDPALIKGDYDDAYCHWRSDERTQIYENTEVKDVVPPQMKLAPPQ